MKSSRRFMLRTPDLGCENIFSFRFSVDGHPNITKICSLERVKPNLPLFLASLKSLPLEIRLFAFPLPHYSSRLRLYYLLVVVLLKLPPKNLLVNDLNEGTRNTRATHLLGAIWRPRGESKPFITSTHLHPWISVRTFFKGKKKS